MTDELQEAINEALINALKADVNESEFALLVKKIEEIKRLASLG